MVSGETQAAQSVRFGRLAKVYVFLEYMAFGGSLQRARAAHLNALKTCRSIAVFGAGDGRCFGPLLRAAPLAHFDSIEFAERFIREACSRVSAFGESDRVAFYRADAREWKGSPQSYDAVVTHFFLDCFVEADLRSVIQTLSQTLKADGLWIFADFHIPATSGFQRWRARAIIRVLCAFFRWQTDHPLKTLPPMERLLAEAGFIRLSCLDSNGGLIRAALYQRGNFNGSRRE